MLKSSSPIAYRARYIFSIMQPPVRDGVLVIDQGQVRFIGQSAGTIPLIDLGNAAIVPGLCNAHTHLELSSFDTPLGHPGQAFPAWIREVVHWRRAQVGTPEEQLSQRAAAVQRGRQESTASGVMEIRDIASPGWQSGWYHAPLAATNSHIFQEVLGLSTARSEAIFQAVEAVLSQPGSKPNGISPHAPYTVGVELLTKLCALSKQQRIPVAMHLAESLDELELLQSHSGAFYGLLTELDAWDPAAIPRGIRPQEYLKLLAAADRALVIHGNYLGDEDFAFLAARADHMSLVYCPRTHHYFGHARYPLPEILAKGVRVQLGTDSRASNPDLNLWNELRFVADAYPELSLETILHLATSSETGLLAVNDPANFVVLDVAADNPADPYELLFDPSSRVRAMFRQGQQVYSVD